MSDRTHLSEACLKGKRRMSALMGSQEPRIHAEPPFKSLKGRGGEVIELANKAGLVLDPWQRTFVEDAFAQDANGRLLAFEVGLIVPRQNGKGSVLEAAELGWLFRSEGDELFLHTAHHFKTAHEAFLRLVARIKGNAELSSKVKSIRSWHGDESIEMKNGTRLIYIARSRSSGRGFTGDKVVWDEAFNLPDTAVEATLPTLSARPDPQVWYTSMSPDRDIAPCEPLSRLRERARSGQAQAVLYDEWSGGVQDSV
jgi:phage terminase large subunit-like protein